MTLERLDILNRLQYVNDLQAAIDDIDNYIQRNSGRVLPHEIDEMMQAKANIRIEIIREKKTLNINN